jgi:GLPGLI family protein
MKKIITLVAVAALALVTQVSNAQDKIKEGKAVFEISYPDAENMNDQQLAMMPKDVTIYFKDGKSRSEMSMSYGSFVTITDDAKKESIMCMDMMGKKNAIKTSYDEAEKEKAKLGEYDVKITDETKEIAGYKCKKAMITYKKEEKPMEVWFTNDVAGTQSGRYSYKGIDGFMMEFSMVQQGMTMKMTCTSLDKKALVSDDKFKIPDGFTVMTQEEMQKQWGGGK